VWWLDRGVLVKGIGKGREGERDQIVKLRLCSWYLVVVANNTIALFNGNARPLEPRATLHPRHNNFMMLS